MNNKELNLLSSVFDYLNKSVPYAVLRNYEGLPAKNCSRDIDIAISYSDYKRIRLDLLSIIENEGWKITNYLNSDRLITYVCAYISDSSTHIIQWDFFFNTSVFGIQILTIEELLNNKEFNGNLYHVSKEYEFLDKYLYNRAVGEGYPTKYNAVRKSVENNDFVNNEIKRIYGVASISMCDVSNSKKMLRHILVSNLKKNPICTVYNIFNFLYTFIKNYIGSNTGFSIAFTGPDGSGKTTIIDQIQSWLSPVFGSATTYFHFRPSIIPNAGDVAFNVGVKESVDREYDKPHRGSATGRLSSIVRLSYYSVDYILGYFIKVKTMCRITRLVIFDRYYNDIITDSRRSKIYLNHQFLYWWGRLFIPSMNYNILLTADTDLILQRKQELDRAGIETINEKIFYLSKKKNYKLIRNEGQPEKAVREILEFVLEKQHEKNMKRLK